MIDDSDQIRWFLKHVFNKEYQILKPCPIYLNAFEVMSRSVVDLSIAAVVDGWSVDGNLRDLPSPILPSVP